MHLGYMCGSVWYSFCLIGRIFLNILFPLNTQRHTPLSEESDEQIMCMSVKVGSKKVQYTKW